MREADGVRHVIPDTPTRPATIEDATWRRALQRRDRYDRWLAARVEPPAAPITGLRSIPLARIDLDRDALAQLGWTDGLSATRRIGAEGHLILGNYAEDREIYSGAVFQPAGLEPRTFHIGLDVFAPQGTPVLAVADGMIESIADNVGAKDYGPTIILRHDLADLSFFTLYGHLGRDCLHMLKSGDSVKQGTAIAVLGDPTVNGDWPPHLHFQIILDLLGHDGDFPGAVRASEAAYWQLVSPDPLGFLGLSKPIQTWPAMVSRLDHRSTA